MNRRDFLYRSAGLGAAAASWVWRGRAAAGLAPQAQTDRPARSPAGGPLRVHPENRRYFTDGSGKAIYLTGSHTWSNPTTGKAAAAGTTDGGARRELTAPFEGDAVVYVYVTDGQPRG